jgi:hypothetical protein
LLLLTNSKLSSFADLLFEQPMVQELWLEVLSDVVQ